MVKSARSDWPSRPLLERSCRRSSIDKAKASRQKHRGKSMRPNEFHDSTFVLCTGAQPPGTIISYFVLSLPMYLLGWPLMVVDCRHLCVCVCGVLIEDCGSRAATGYFGQTFFLPGASCGTLPRAGPRAEASDSSGAVEHMCMQQQPHDLPRPCCCLYKRSDTFALLTTCHHGRFGAAIDRATVALAVCAI